LCLYFFLSCLYLCLLCLYLCLFYRYFCLVSILLAAICAAMGESIFAKNANNKWLPMLLSRVARFFMVQHTKMGKNIPKDH
jgi:hypothetical protein